MEPSKICLFSFFFPPQDCVCASSRLIYIPQSIYFPVDGHLHCFQLFAHAKNVLLCEYFACLLVYICKGISIAYMQKKNWLVVDYARLYIYLRLLYFYPKVYQSPDLPVSMSTSYSKTLLKLGVVKKFKFSLWRISNI